MHCPFRVQKCSKIAFKPRCTAVTQKLIQEHKFLNAVCILAHIIENKIKLCCVYIRSSIYHFCSNHTGLLSLHIQSYRLDFQLKNHGIAKLAIKRHTCSCQLKT